MASRMGAIAAVIAFAVCVITGGLVGDNPVSTTLSRALMAMGGMFVIGLVCGWMLERMATESITVDEKSKDQQVKTGEADR